MRYTTKIRLIPESTFDNFERQQLQITPVTVSKLTDVDEEMKSILEARHMTDAEKDECYRAALEKYLRFKDKIELESKQPVNVYLETQANDTDN